MVDAAKVGEVTEIKERRLNATTVAGVDISDGSALLPHGPRETATAGCNRGAVGGKARRSPPCSIKQTGIPFSVHDESPTQP